MDTSGAPTCPECGFRIYNRRFPNCESCGAALPDTLVYSAAERFALQQEEDERALERGAPHRGRGLLDHDPGLARRRRPHGGDGPDRALIRRAAG
jgi:hypothetical protein